MRAVEDPRLLGGGPIGLLTNYTGTMPDLGRSAEALVAAGAPISVLFSPEHGLNGSAQAGFADHSSTDDATGLPVIDTYLAFDQDLDRLIADSGVSTIVFDMQDIGVRYYTYVWSLYDCMLSAARTGVRMVVLDRPNPLGGLKVSGPGLKPAFSSFVGRVDVAQRHGLTTGELARLFQTRDLAALGLTVALDVVTLEGWNTGGDFSETGLQWVMPSPNMPTLETAYAFAGTGLFEGTNVSEGRGTTKPFEMIGAPYVDGRLAGRLRDAGVPGAMFREVWFSPTFHKYAGRTIRGVQVHITDRAAFEPITTALTMIDAFADLYRDDFTFLPPGERSDESHRGYAIDRLWGSARLRECVNRGAATLDLHPEDRSPEDMYGPEVLLYPRYGGSLARK